MDIHPGPLVYRHHRYHGSSVVVASVKEAQIDQRSVVFANRDGGWMSLANVRRSLRAALPGHLTWVTPHSFRRSVATVVRDTHGVEAAQQRLSHAKLATTEARYLQRRTHGPEYPRST